MSAHLDPHVSTPKPDLDHAGMDLKADLPASLVVFFVAVPLCLGIALASGAPLFSGLIAGIVGGIIVGAISGSPLGVSGPAAGLAVIVLQAIDKLGMEAFLVAVVLAGLIQLILGIMRAGVLGYFFPSSVIQGMLAGIGILIFLKQIPHAFGHDSDPEGSTSFDQPDGENTLSSLGAMWEDVTPAALLVSSVCLVILIFWMVVLNPRFKWSKIVPGPLVAVVFGIVYQVVAKANFPEWALEPIHLVDVPIFQSIGDFKAEMTFPDYSLVAQSGVWITAITLAVVASLETLLCVDATDKLDPWKRVTPTSRELVAQGVGNMVSGAIGGLPVTQVIVRSSANIQSGGRSKLAAILHGCLLLLFVTILPQILNLIPLAALAAILLVVGFKLARPALFKAMFDKGWSQFLPFVITIAAIVFTDLLTGIGVGMLAAIFAILRSHYMNSHFLHMQESDGPDGTHNVRIELAEEVTFLNKAAILKALNELPDGTHVVIDATRSVFVDHDVVEIIDEFETTAATRDIRVERIGDLNEKVTFQPAKRPQATVNS